MNRAVIHGTVLLTTCCMFSQSRREQSGFRLTNLMYIKNPRLSTHLNQKLSSKNIVEFSSKKNVLGVGW